MDWARLCLVAGASLATAGLAMGATALVSRRVGKVSVVDITWGLTFVAIAWMSAALGSGRPQAAALLGALVTRGVDGWRGKCPRAPGPGEDPRYEELLVEAPPGRRFSYAVRKVFVVQGLSGWFVSLPVQVAAVTSVSPGAGPLVVVAVGVVGWAVGVTFEAVGDAQLAAFKADPANRGSVMDRGLWAWTRHPNYFGDATVWWGVWLVRRRRGRACSTVLSPAAMTYFLAFATGARLLEKQMSTRPGYREYMARTSMFLPLPPRPRPPRPNFPA